MRTFILFFCLLSIASACFACAATTPAQKADKTYAEFIRACSKSDPDAANHYMLDASLRIDPCPSDSPEKAPKTDIIASHPMAQMILENGSWKLYPSQQLTPNSPQLVLKQLKYAIINQDPQELMQLLSTPHTEEELKTWLLSAEANEIYAAIAITPNPWFIIEGKLATCKTAGRQLQFELIENVWKWRMN